MTTATTPEADLTHAPIRQRRADFAGALRSETTKIWSVRSTFWSLIVLVLAGVCWSVAFTAGEAAKWSHLAPLARSTFDPTQSTVLGLALLGQMVIVVLGALAITAEYHTGMIRTSLTMVPRRGLLYTAKAVAFAVVALVIAVPTSLASFFIGQWLLASTHVAATLTQPAALRAVTLAAVYVVLAGLFSFGLAATLRSSAGAIVAVFGLLFLLPELARALPAAWYAHVVRWLPGPNVVSVITNTQGKQNVPPHLFSVWGELGLFAGCTAILLVAGAVLFSRRDA
jgi:ABC-2 type transport system permease protein